ncbi:MAG: non-homologous end-joining DNA ligase [Acidimicrobiia bacterium]|nr:non-homologous end-joining DNA ligase [Acidimicrobiia bacterium]
MKAVLGELPVGDEWVYELKWDGMRVLAHVVDGQVRLRSGNEIDVTHRFPELEGLADVVGDRPVVFDGEVVAVDDRRRPSFSQLQHRMHVGDRVEAVRRAAEVPVGYQIFDLLHFDGHDVMPLALRDRRHLLEELVAPGPAWRLTDQFDDGVALLDHAARHGLEGLVAKQRGSRYVPGARSRSWCKVKIRLEQDFVVAGTTEGTGGRASTFGALLLGYWFEGGLRFAGRVGTGFGQAELERLSGLLAPLRTAVDPFTPRLGAADARGAAFVDPRIVVQVAYAEWSPDGRLRHPTYLGQRHDVDAADVGVER